MKKWVCKVCGYIYEGPEAPAECPVCHAKSNMFEEVKGEMKLAPSMSSAFMPRP